jgi:predicted MPP superfamily phosphohydrolase
MVYATRFEPFNLGVTHIEVQTPKIPTGERLRLVQIADLHIERITSRERDLIEQVNALDADWVLYTGDYLSFSYIGEQQAISDARQVLGALHARRGAYAVRGTHQIDPNALLPTLFEGLPIRWLRSEHAVLDCEKYHIAFAGASCTREPEIDVPAVARALDGIPPDAFTVLLYHTPDLVPEALSGGADLYLAGHTHGGQIRLPVYGAVMTATAVGKRYEMGRYEVDGLTLYVSRGIGMEGRGAPRARFLCPPEIVCIDVTGTG